MTKEEGGEHDAELTAPATVDKASLGDTDRTRLLPTEAEPIPVEILLETDQFESILRSAYKDLFVKYLAAGNSTAGFNLEEFCRWSVLNPLLQQGRVVVAQAGAEVRGRFVPKRKSKSESQSEFLVRREVAREAATRAFDEACRFAMHPGGVTSDETALSALTAASIAARAAAEGEKLHPTGLSKEDISPERMEPGETVVNMQRHGEPGADGLTESAIDVQRDTVTDYVDRLLIMLPPDERSTVDFLVVASDSPHYSTDNDLAYETATLTQRTIIDVLASHGLSSAQVLQTAANIRHGHDSREPWSLSGLREPLFHMDPAFIDYVTRRYGGFTDEFLRAYDSGSSRALETRRKDAGLESPAEVAERAAITMDQLIRYSEAYHRHEANKGRRLVIWAMSNEEAISTFARTRIFSPGRSWRKHALDVPYGAGFGLNIYPDGNMRYRLSGRSYYAKIRRQNKGN